MVARVRWMWNGARVGGTGKRSNVCPEVTVHATDVRVWVRDRAWRRVALI